MKKLLLALWLALAAQGALAANNYNILDQPSGGGFTYTGILSGLPATCTVGQIAFVTNATPGQNQYNCTATNTWTQNLNSGSGGASTALSNLASVNVNLALLPQTSLDLGSTTKPWRDLFLYGSGTYGTNYFRFTGTPTGTRIITLPDAAATLLYSGGPGGTPSSMVGTNITGTAAGFTAGTATTATNTATKTGNTATYATSTGSLTSGNCASWDANGNIVDAGGLCGGSGSTGANPTASVGLAAVNGVATTYLRSDGAPPLSQAIVPTWTGIHTFTPAARSSGVAPYLVINAPADTGLTASTEAIGINFVAATRQHATGAIATQREYVFNAPTYTAVGATVITGAGTVAISGPPIAGTNVTITNPYALLVQSGNVRFTGGIHAGSAGTVLVDSAGKILSAALNTVANAQGGAGGTFNSACATFVITPSSANLASCISDETGSGANVFAVQPTLTAPILTVQALSCNTATPTWTVSAGNIATCTLNSTNITPSVTTSSLTGGSIAIKIIQSATARTITWPNGNGTSTLKVKWPSGTAPTLSTASGAEDTVTCNVYSEFIWHCVWAGAFQ